MKSKAIKLIIAGKVLKLAAVAAFFYFSGHANAEQCSRNSVFAMSPYDLKCQEFDSSCEVPKNWIPVSTCDLTSLVTNFDGGGMGDPRQRVATTLRDAKKNGSTGAADPSQAAMQYMNQGQQKEPPPPAGGMGFYSGGNNNQNDSYFFGKRKE